MALELKHILRIHNTQANLYANLKDKQIAWATDTKTIIWRDGSEFYTLQPNFAFDGVDNDYLAQTAQSYATTLDDGTTTGSLNANTNVVILESNTGSDIVLLADGGSGDIIISADTTGTLQDALGIDSNGKIVTYTPSTQGAGLQIESTGIKSGSAISINVDNTKWDLASGEAYIMDYSNPLDIKEKLVAWTTQSTLTVDKLLTEKRSNLAISLVNTDPDGDASVSFTNSFTGTIDGVSGTIYIAQKSDDNFNAKQKRSYANIGRLVHTNQTNISNAVGLQQHTESVLSSYLDFVSLFPAINVEGNEFSGVTSTLGVQKTAGKGFRFGSNYQADLENPNIQDIPSANPTTHFYRYQDGSGGFSQVGPSSVLDPTQYDNGSGTLQGVNNNQWTAQPVWVFAGSGTMFVQYGQQLFSSKNASIEALATINPVLDQNLVNDAVFRGWFIVRGGATDTTDLNDFEWRPPLSERGSGSGQGIVVDLQVAYENSLDPEIVTDSTRGALTLKRGSVADTDNVLEVQNGAGTTNFSVDGEGSATFSGDVSTQSDFILLTGGGGLRPASNASVIEISSNPTLNTGANFALYGTSSNDEIRLRYNTVSQATFNSDGFQIINNPLHINDNAIVDNGSTYTGLKMLVRDPFTDHVEEADIPSGGGEEFNVSFVHAGTTTASIVLDTHSSFSTNSVFYIPDDGRTYELKAMILTNGITSTVQTSDVNIRAYMFNGTGAQRAVGNGTLVRDWTAISTTGAQAVEYYTRSNEITGLSDTLTNGQFLSLDLVPNFYSMQDTAVEVIIGVS